MKLGKNSLIHTVSTIEWKIVDDEAVLLNFKNGDYFSLNQIGTMLWSAASHKPIRLDSLINMVSSEYTCTEAEATKDVIEWCEQMLNEKLLEVRN